ncbi:MAG: bifunctional UDP-3-O-[3-hydroxymyristoyl] N-acetylglucosamine deacetylase/3-hydroxyacyl-ACP dehydratase [Bacteroidales bacterium]|nr:bifunctional UDP-3-O-[3-hydroxymyristoyl] N-acetylglucosamine deacetylase/3-hydroxyacyl-ACP dehydratase [Bacteroidales bacterium]
MVDKQKTIKTPVSITGVGLHTGKNVTLTFNPAPENTGYVFRRTDLEGQPLIKADVDNVVDTSRGTTLAQNGAQVSTIEHCLAALVGMQIDNCIIDIDCVESPILDGSSRYYVEALEKAGILEQDALKEWFEITENIHFFHNEKDAEMIAIPADNYRISCMIDYKSQVLGHQHAQINNISEFKDEIANSRTFVFLHELEFLLKQNLIKGGDLCNAIVFVDREISQEELDKLAVLFNKPTVKVLSQGVLNNVDLYHQNEPARHKLLDVVGDLALIGTPIKGHIIANKPGHASNVLFAKKIKEAIKQEKINQQVPKYDPNIPPKFDINEVKKMLPHRWPFLLVDKILEVSESHVIGVKNVTFNETFFVGHFPKEPIMPGVLIIEAMAQAGGILGLCNVDDPENYSTYFMKIDNVRFKQKVIPGDTLVFRLSLLSPVRRGIYHMKGMAYVGNKVVMEAELMAQIIKTQSN